MVALTLGLGVLLFAFARELFGPSPRQCSPSRSSLRADRARPRPRRANGRAGGVWLRALFYAMYRYAAQPIRATRRVDRRGRGVALLAKFSMLLAGPVLFVFFAVRAVAAAATRDGPRTHCRPGAADQPARYQRRILSSSIARLRRRRSKRCKRSFAGHRAGPGCTDAKRCRTCCRPSSFSAFSGRSRIALKGTPQVCSGCTARQAGGITSRSRSR